MEAHDLINKFHEDHEVLYEMRVLIDGEPYVRFTDGTSFDQLTGYAALGDQAMVMQVMAEATDKAEHLAEPVEA